MWENSCVQTQIVLKPKMKKTTSNTREKQPKDTTDSIGEGRECEDRCWSLLGMPVTIRVWYYLQKWLLSVPCANMGVNANPYVPGWHLWVYTPRVVCIPLPSADRMHQSTSVEVLITNKVTQEQSTDRQENGWVHVTHTCTVLIKEQEKWIMVAKQWIWEKSGSEFYIKDEIIFTMKQNFCHLIR